LLGFSQGACLSLEFAARNAHRYGGIAGLTGGLIGPDGTPRNYQGSLDGTPVFIGSSNPDPHIPVARVDETQRVLERMGAQVTKRIYPGMGHTINAEELDYVRQIMNEVVTTSGVPRNPPQS
jgi:predicted esterase